MPAKIALGMIVRDDAEMLAITLPRLLAGVDGVFAVDGCSRDGTPDVLGKHGARIVSRAWDSDFGGARNAAIALAENADGFTHMLMLDADECLLEKDFAALRLALDDAQNLAFALARYEFVDDYQHFNPGFYPDWQARVFPLRQGFSYTGRIHEQLVVANVGGTAFQAGRCVPLPYVHIFHYGKTKPVEQLWIKYQNYARLTAGLPLVTEVPPGVVVPKSFSNGPRLLFTGERPL